MTKTSSSIGNTFRTGGRFRAFFDPAAAARFVDVILCELRTAIAAENEHQNLKSRSARQLTRMGLARADLSGYIRRKYY